ncbi:hypothetical protein OQA88_8186 [Cercophora sp. LCS_1]
MVENSSWILGRIVRDFGMWGHPASKAMAVANIESTWARTLAKDPAAKKPTRGGLVVSIYQPSTRKPAGVPERDVVYWSGIVTILLQLCVAAIPCAISSNWGILMITACGTALSLLTGMLPQWEREKWACRRRSNDTYVLTRGNGAQHAIVVLGNGRGLNLEDLAAGQSNMDTSTSWSTRIATVLLAVSWVLLLLTAPGLVAELWFLIAVGGIGIVHNIVVAGCARRPESFGIPLEFVTAFGQSKVMRTLFEVEQHYPALGRSMVSEFFSGNLTADEERRWNELEVAAAAAAAAKTMAVNLNLTAPSPLHTRGTMTRGNNRVEPILPLHNKS